MFFSIVGLPPLLTVGNIKKVVEERATLCIEEYDHASTVKIKIFYEAAPVIDHQDLFNQYITE